MAVLNEHPSQLHTGRLAGESAAGYGPRAADEYDGLKAMILAAGRGERLRPLTDRVPKPLLEVGGQPLLAWHILALRTAGCSELVINLGHLGARIRTYCGCGERFGVTVHYSQEPPGALETGGGIQQALPLLGPDPFVVVNGDVWTDYPLADLPAQPGGLAHLVLVDNPAHHPAGDFALRAGRVTLDSEPRLTFAGISVLRPGLFAGWRPGCFPLAPLLAAAAASGQVGGEHYRGRWYDVGTPARLQQVDTELHRAGPVADR